MLRRQLGKARRQFGVTAQGLDPLPSLGIRSDDQQAVGFQNSLRWARKIQNRGAVGFHGSQAYLIRRMPSPQPSPRRRGSEQPGGASVWPSPLPSPGGRGSCLLYTSPSPRDGL